MINNSLIEVKQLPIIVEQLHEVKSEITEKVEQALSFVCSEDTVKDIKKIRAELSKEFKDYEERRKIVKNAIMTPYEKFETVYKDCVSNVFKKADTELKRKIDSVENELKDNKTAEVKGYFDEYRDSMIANGITWLGFADAHINVTLSASMKSLKEQAKAFIDKIVDDLALIDTQEHRDEILYHYKKTDGMTFLNASKAITLVNAKFKAIEEAKAKEEERKARVQAEAEAAKKVEKVTETVSPAVIEPPVEEEPILTLRFTVRAKRSKLRELKEFLERGNYDYE